MTPPARLTTPEDGPSRRLRQRLLDRATTIHALVPYVEDDVEMSLGEERVTFRARRPDLPAGVDWEQARDPITVDGVEYAVVRCDLTADQRRRARLAGAIVERRRVARIIRGAE